MANAGNKLWITHNPTSGTGSATVNVTVSPNTGRESRTATFNVDITNNDVYEQGLGQTPSTVITQKAGSPIFSVKFGDRTLTNGNKIKMSFDEYAALSMAQQTISGNTNYGYVAVTIIDTHKMFGVSNDDLVLQMSYTSPDTREDVDDYVSTPNKNGGNVTDDPGRYTKFDFSTMGGIVVTKGYQNNTLKAKTSTITISAAIEPLTNGVTDYDFTAYVEVTAPGRGGTVITPSNPSVENRGGEVTLTIEAPEDISYNIIKS